MICWTVENGRHVTGTIWRIPQGFTTSHVEVNNQVTERFLSSSFIGFHCGVSLSQLRTQNTNLFRISSAVEKNYLCDVRIDCLRIFGPLKCVAKPSNGRCDVDQQLLVPRILCFLQLRRKNHATPTKFFSSALQLFAKSSILSLEWIQYQHVWTDSPSIWCRNFADNVYKSKWFCRSWVKIFFLDWQSYAQWVCFSRSCRAHNRNETVRWSAYALNHCFGVGRIWPKQADKSANMPDANLLSASQSVRKVIQKTTRIRITKWLIKITSSTDRVLYFYRSKSSD